MTSELLSMPGAVVRPLRRRLPPLEYTLPPVSAAPSVRRHSIGARVAALGMWSTAIWLAADNDTFRALEARLVTPIAGFVAGRHEAVASHSMVWFALGTRRAFGLQITNECTSALLLIPLLVLLGSFAMFAHLGLSRILKALIAGVLLILVVNVLRVAGIAWATWKWGLGPGYSYSHIFVGSAFSLVGFVGAMLLAMWMLVRGDRPAVLAAIGISRAWWVRRAPATHRMATGGRGQARGRMPAAHRYHAR